MPISEIYKSQVKLLIRCLPAIDQVPFFALKGGTAINLFCRNMPRISVDIDLAYLTINDRETALSEIRSGIISVSENLRRVISRVQIQIHGETPRLYVSLDNAQIKVEVNTTIRGTLLPPLKNSICTKAQQQFSLFAEVQRLADADLYGGKLCAALDRQHPRDLFDVMLLQVEGAIPDEIRHAFVIYLASHNRPIAEILAPRIKPLEVTFSQNFSGMTDQPVELSELESTRIQLFKWAVNALTENERKFLLSIKQGEPDWDQMPYPGINRLPAIQWKLRNVRQMSTRNHSIALARLRKLLNL